MKYILSALALAGVLFSTTPAMAKTPAYPVAKPRATSHKIHRSIKAKHIITAAKTKAAPRASARKHSVSRKRSTVSLAKAKATRVRKSKKTAPMNAAGLYQTDPSIAQYSGMSQAGKTKVSRGRRARKSRLGVRVPRARKSRSKKSSQGSMALPGLSDMQSSDASQPFIFSIPLDSQVLQGGSQNSISPVDNDGDSSLAAQELNSNVPQDQAFAPDLAQADAVNSACN